MHDQQVAKWQQQQGLKEAEERTKQKAKEAKEGKDEKKAGEKEKTGKKPQRRGGAAAEALADREVKKAGGCPEITLDLNSYQSRRIAFDAMTGQLGTGEAKSQPAKKGSARSETKDSEVKGASTACTKIYEDLELFLCLELVSQVPEILARDAKARTQFLDRCATFAVNHPDKANTVRSAMALCLQQHIENVDIIEKGPSVIRDLLTLDETKKEMGSAFKTAYTSVVAGCALTVLQYFGNKSMKYEEKSAVRYAYVWHPEFEKLLNQFCTHPDATVRGQALRMVTRGASPIDVRADPREPSWAGGTRDSW